MGNYISCTLAPPLIKHAKAARVIFPSGEVKQFKPPLKAAELMLDCPSYFLADSRSLHIGRRFFALAADDELEFGSVYIFFPMRRLNSIVTAADLAVFFMAANSAAKRISGKNSVVPAAVNSGGEIGGSRLNLDEIESGFQNRLTYCRSRKPVLETINEEPIRLKWRTEQNTEEEETE